MRRDEYTVQRFLTSGTSKKTSDMLRKTWKENDQLVASKVPRDGMVQVVIMAAWGTRVDMELVDDYDALLERMRDIFKEGDVEHPDAFFASSICIMAARGDELTVGGFEQLNIPSIFCDLLGIEEDE